MNALNPRFPFVLAVLGVIGCAPQQSQSEPQTGPPGVDIEYHDRDDDTGSKNDDSASQSSDTDSKSSKTKSSESDEGSSTESSSSSSSKSESAPAKKSCAGLKKKDCEVMVGCAWSTDKICVNQ